MSNELNDIDRHILNKLLRENPGYAISISHRFMGGYEPNPYGAVPNDWSGKTLYFQPKSDWWGWKYLQQ